LGSGPGGLLGAKSLKYGLYVGVASAAAATGFAVIGYLLDGGQSVFANNAGNFSLGNTEAGANDLALGVSANLLASVVVLYGSFEGFAAHDGAVHLLLRQAIKIIGDVLVGHLLGLLQSFSLYHLGEGTAGGDGRAAAEGLEFDLGYSALLVEFKH